MHRSGYRVAMSEQQPEEGQVSEVVRLDPEHAETPLSDSDHVAGYPDSESGQPDEGSETGPDAHTGSEHDEPVRDEDETRGEDRRG